MKFTDNFCRRPEMPNSGEALVKMLFQDLPAGAREKNAWKACSGEGTGF